MRGILAIMLSPNDLFDLTDFAHRAIFADARYAWEALGRLDEYLKAHLRPGIKGILHPGAWIEGEVELGEGSVVEPGAFILGPTIIGRGCQIRQGAYLRGRIIVGDGAIVGHCSELKGAILLNHAGAPHFNYVGDSLLGNKVNLGAGTICSNFKLTGELISVRVGDWVVNTGMRKLGAIIGDGTQTGCNSVLNPGTVLGKNTLVYPCASVRGYHPSGSILKLDQSLGMSPRELAGEQDG